MQVKHVHDAFTLLKSSIVNLDQPDLELEQEEVPLQQEDMRDSEAPSEQVQAETRKVKLD